MKSFKFLSKKIDTDFLLYKLPSIEKVLKKKKFSKKEILSLKHIYQHYKHKSENNKSSLRNALKKKRDSLNILKIKKKSYKINKKVIRLKEYKTAKTVFCYISFSYEIDTHLIIDHAFKNKRVAVPVIINDKIVPALLTNFEKLKKNKFGIYEPEEIIPVPIDEIDITIVPALAFSPIGYRIGYGGGFYDRFLKEYKGFSLGMAFKDFLITDIIPDENDMPVDKVITL